jgi:predicted secreted protein
MDDKLLRYPWVALLFVMLPFAVEAQAVDSKRIDGSVISSDSLEKDIALLMSQVRVKGLSGVYSMSNN